MRNLLFCIFLISVITGNLFAQDGSALLVSAPSSEDVKQARDIVLSLVRAETTRIVDRVKTRCVEGVLLKSTDQDYWLFIGRYNPGESYKRILQDFNSEIEFYNFVETQVMKTGIAKLLGLL